MSKKKLFLTTPIFYLNGKPHLGHAYTIIIADIISRYKKSRGYQVFLQTGSDEHGEKIEKTAKKKGLLPKDLLKNNLLFFQEMLAKLNISKHLFFRTSSKKHQKKVQEHFKKLFFQRDIYFGNYEGVYCLVCENFIWPKKNEKKCLICGSLLEKIEEPAFFLKTVKHYDWLQKYYEKHSDFIFPFSVKKDLINDVLKNNLRDLCLTRRGISLGVSIPKEVKRVELKGFSTVIYVWFDALLNYINSSFGEQSFKNERTEIVHLIGKDISRFHCVYWPIILKQLSLRLPNKILVHGWILNKGEKMSKSKDNVLSPLVLLEKKYSADLLRLYFVSEITFFQDGKVSEDLLKQFFQEFLLNNLGNLVSRLNKMVWIYNNGQIPQYAFSKNVFLKEYQQNCQEISGSFVKKMDNYQLTLAFLHLKDLLKKTNKLVNDISPWKKFFSEKKLVDDFLNYSVNGLKIISFFLNFFAPETSKNILENFSLEKIKISWKNHLNFSLINNVNIKKTTHLF